MSEMVSWRDRVTDNLGTMLRQGRKDAGLTQREMADVLGVDFTYVSKIENDRVGFPPSDRVLTTWAVRCGLDPDAVFVAAGKCPPDLFDRLCTDLGFVQRVRLIAPN